MIEVKNQEEKLSEDREPSNTLEGKEGLDLCVEQAKRLVELLGEAKDLIDSLGGVKELWESLNEQLPCRKPIDFEKVIEMFTQKLTQTMEEAQLRENI